MGSEYSASIPSHVGEDQVFEYDYYEDPRFELDVQRGMRSLHAEAPDVFYTPRNGGFWMVTRHDLMEKLLRDTTHFSNSELQIPRSDSPHVMIPLNLDPPDHLPYRMVLMRHFDQKAIRTMEPFLRDWAGRLIDPVVARGECEFAEAIGAGFPVSVFIELMGLPHERFAEFRSIVHEYFSPITVQRRIELQEEVIGIMWAEFEKRRADPKDDLMSKLLSEKVRDRLLTDEELKSIAFLLFLAGLDTVANALSFTFYHLAKSPDLQKRLVEDPASTPAFVEEMLRRCSLIQTPRIVKKDVVFSGATMKVGDMVVCPTALAGLDDQCNPDPETIDIDRAPRSHLAFGTGPHTCVGNFLARMEMRIMVEEWLRRIPSFRLNPDVAPKWRGGGVAALSNIHLTWDASR